MTGSSWRTPLAASAALFLVALLSQNHSGAADPPNRKWKTGVFTEAAPLEGPLVVTFLKSAVDPAKTTPKRFIMILGNRWISPEDFTGELYLERGQRLVPRKEGGQSPEEVIYSGYVPEQ